MFASKNISYVDFYIWIKLVSVIQIETYFSFDEQVLIVGACHVTIQIAELLACSFSSLLFYHCCYWYLVLWTNPERSGFLSWLHT